MNLTSPHQSAETIARVELITAILDAAAFIANTVEEGATSSIVGDRTLADLLEHGYRLSQELKRDIEESV